MGWLVTILIALVVVGMVTPVQIAVYYGRIGENDHLVVEMTAWFRLIRRKYELPVVALKSTAHGPEVVARVESVRQTDEVNETVRDMTGRQIKKWYHSYRDALENIHDMRPLLQEFFKHIRCTRLEWHTMMGTGQASETGALTGIVWSVKSLIVGILSHSLSLRTIPRMSVQPIWNQACIRTQFRCVLRFYLGHALVTAAKMYLRRRKGRERQWQTNPSGAG